MPKEQLTKIDIVKIQMVRDGTLDYGKKAIKGPQDLAEIGLGLPYDVAVAALKTWALKNKPTDSKRIIQDREIISKTQDAYKKSYTGYGCGTEAVGPFCEPSCPVKQWKEKNRVPPGKAEHKETIGL